MLPDYKHQALASSIIPTEMERAYGCFLVILSLWALLLSVAGSGGSTHLLKRYLSLNAALSLKLLSQCPQAPLCSTGLLSLHKATCSGFNGCSWFFFYSFLKGLLVSWNIGGLHSSRISQHLICPMHPFLNSDHRYFTHFCSITLLANVTDIIKHCPHKSFHNISQFFFPPRQVPALQLLCNRSN